VNVLEKIATFVGVTLVGSRQPFERRTERRGCLGIPLVLTGRPACITHSIQVVARVVEV
jgi:hypothetical protein